MSGLAILGTKWLWRTANPPIRVEDATAVGILRAAVSGADGGVVEAEWAGRVAVATPITVGEGTVLPVTGEGNLAEVHAGGSHTRLFEVSQGGGLPLIRVTLWGGSAEADGAIHSRATHSTLNHCIFDSNVATDGNLGAVRAKGGNVTIVGVEFAPNSETRYGGAVHATDGRLEVRGESRLEGNAGIGVGAGFCGVGAVGSSKQTAICSITDAEFVTNSAAREGEESVGQSLNLDGGGATGFPFAEVDITPCCSRVGLCMQDTTPMSRERMQVWQQHLRAILRWRNFSVFHEFGGGGADHKQLVPHR